MALNGGNGKLHKDGGTAKNEMVAMDITFFSTQVTENWALGIENVMAERTSWSPTDELNLYQVEGKRNEP